MKTERKADEAMAKLRAKNEDKAPLDMAMVQRLVAEREVEIEAEWNRRRKEAAQQVSPPPDPRKFPDYAEENKRWIYGHPEIVYGTGAQSPAPSATPTPASTPMPPSTPTVNYQIYKTIGPLTPWEIALGGLVAHNAHLLLAQADKYYFWGTGAIENNQIPPLAGQNIALPIPTLSPDMKISVPGIPDVFAYTGGKTPFVCGDVPDWSYYMAGYNLQLQFPEVSAQYPNRWPRSSYGYEYMFQMINLGEIEGKREAWNVQTSGNNYSFTPENVPELGDFVVTKTGSNLDIPDAGHVVLVAEVQGLTPDQIIIIEGNPDEGTLVKHTLEELKNRITGLMYIIYGHPNLP